MTTVYAGVACLSPVLIGIAVAPTNPCLQVWALVGLGAALMAARRTRMDRRRDGHGVARSRTRCTCWGTSRCVPRWLVRRGAKGTGVGPAIDAAIPSVAAAAVMWFLVVGPALAGSACRCPRR